MVAVDPGRRGNVLGIRKVEVYIVRTSAVPPQLNRGGDQEQEGGQG